VPDAEVTLWAVDEGILSLVGDPAPDPWSFFHRERLLQVSSAISLPSLMPEDPEELAFRNKGFLIGGGGATRVRQKFLPCAFWSARLRTDASGRARADFTVPDSLTRYRILAVAHAGADRFGSGQAVFTVNKPLMLEPALPRFANVTDRIQARAVLHSRGTAAGEAIVTLELDHHATHAAAGSADAPAGTSRVTRRVNLTAGGSSVVEFPTTFVEPGPSRWTWRARLIEPPQGAFEDAVQSTIEIGHVAPLIREVRAGRVDLASTNLLDGLNPQILEGRGTVTVRVANSRLLELGEAVAHLLHYPYGCAEQTSSSLLPWVVLRRSPLRGLLGRPEAEMDRAIRAGVDRLLSMQTPSGGLTYWPRDDQPAYWASAYGACVLTLAARQGAVVPQESLRELRTWLASGLRQGQDQRDLIPARCLALYTLALAGEAQAAYHETFFEQRHLLSAEDRAVLALAVLEAGGSSNMVQTLLTEKPSAPVAERAWFGSLAREQAWLLMAWLRHQPHAPVVERLATEMTAGRKEAHWGTTQANAWALLALHDYAERVEGQRSLARGSLEWEGQTAAFELPEAGGFFERTFALRAGEAKPSLWLRATGQTRLFTLVSAEARARVVHQPAQHREMLLRRSYARLDQENRPGPLEGLRVGDRVLVSLELSLAEPAHYVVVDDALPALFEAVKGEFRTSQGAPSGLGDVWEQWVGDHRELRADRTLHFANALDAGRYMIRYLARVRAAGQVTAPAAKAEEMYNPDRFALTETVTISAQPSE